MVEMVVTVEIPDERLSKRSVERVSYVINNLLHLVIVKYSHFTRSLNFYSPSTRDNTVSTREISHHISH